MDCYHIAIGGPGQIDRTISIVFVCDRGCLAGRESKHVAGAKACNSVSIGACGNVEFCDDAARI